MKKIKKMRGGGMTKSSAVSRASAGAGIASRAAQSASKPSGRYSGPSAGPSKGIGPSSPKPSGRYSGPSAGPSYKGGIAGAMAPRTTSMVKSLRGYAAGGIVGAPARSYKDMKAGAGSGVGRIQKTKIAGRGR